MAVARKAETMIMREFRDIDGYEGLYKVSNYGEVYSVRKGKNLSAGKSSSGYLTVGLCKNGKERSFRINRLVAKAFIPNPDSKAQVNHVDGNKLNNRVDNLEWCTPYENVHHSMEVLGNNGKPIVCIETGVVYRSINEAERETGIRSTGIGKVCKGRRKTSGGLHWKYAEKVAK